MKVCSPGVCGRPRWPCSKSQDVTPREAMSEKPLMSRALSGTTSDPVMQNSSAKTAVMTMSAAHGARSTMESMRSVCCAAAPPTQNR